MFLGTRRKKDVVGRQAAKRRWLEPFELALGSCELIQDANDIAGRRSAFEHEAESDEMETNGLHCGAGTS